MAKILIEIDDSLLATKNYNQIINDVIAELGKTKELISTDIIEAFVESVDAIIETEQLRDMKKISKKLTHIITKKRLYNSFHMFCNVYRPNMYKKLLSKNEFMQIFENVFNKNSKYTCKINNDKSWCIFYYEKINKEVANA